MSSDSTHSGVGPSVPGAPLAPVADVVTHTVAVVGFSAVERTVLGSVFGLSARRNPRFIPFAPGEQKMPSMFMIDADDPRCGAYLAALATKSSAPVLLVGASQLGTKFPLMARPIQWGRTLEMLGQTIAQPGRIDTAPRAGAATAASRAAVQLQRPVDRVLVVDDSLAVRKFMEVRLAPYGFQVDYAESGEQAIGFTAQHRYTCVFLDVILPNMDGYQVCKLLRARKSVEKPPAVVMLTSKSSPFDRIRGTMAGCDAYLTKPMSEEKLLEVIAKFLPAAKITAQAA